MRIVAAHIFEVVVLARHAHTLLRVDGAFVGTRIGADEHILELHHARVGEQQGGIPARDKRHGRHGGMSVLDEEIYEGPGGSGCLLVFCSCMHSEDLIMTGELYQVGATRQAE